jgi:hypothetical protein
MLHDARAPWGLLALAVLVITSAAMFLHLGGECNVVLPLPNGRVGNDERVRPANETRNAGNGRIEYEGARSANETKNLFRISIVYFTGINPGHPWRELITTQLGELVTFGLAEAASSVSVVLASPSAGLFDDEGELLLENATVAVKQVLPGARSTVFLHSGGQTEYPGIRRVWDVAWEEPSADPHTNDNHVILYFHGKGMFNAPNPGQARSHENSALTKVVVEPWRNVVSLFASDPALHKAGFAAAPSGWIWYNFWWARASYVRQLVRPILTQRRHYYEDWVGRVRDPGGNDAERSEEGGYFLKAGGHDSLTLCSGNQKRALGWVLTPAEIGGACPEIRG